MKILMALDYYRPNYSGLTLFAEQLAGGLARRGHAVSVLTHQHLPELPLESEENGVRVVRTTVAGRLGKALVSPAILVRALREVPRSDVLHLHAPLVNAVPFALIASTLGVPIVVTYHCDLQPPPRLGQRFVGVVARVSQHFALERASRIITNTEDYARNTRPLVDRAEKVGWILPPVLEPVATGRPAAEVRRRLEIAGRPVIFFLGRFAEEKGLPVLLSAFSEIRRRFPDAALVLAGSQKVAGESVLDQVAPLLADPSSGVSATGAVPSETLSDLFTIADVLVLPSINSTESFGMVQVEAMLRGVPVVASDLPGVRQPVLMTGMGEIARPGDAADLARQILAVLGAPERYRRSHSAIQALFSQEQTLSEYEAVYRSVVQTGK